MPSSSSSQYFTTSTGTTTHYISSGTSTGPLIILLHGLGGSIDTFSELITWVPSSYHAVSIDIEGFGKTPLNKSHHLSFSNYVADLGDLITHLQKPSSHTSPTINGNKPVRKVQLIAHSLGAIISLHYAAHNPTAVAGLLLLGVGKSLRQIPPVQTRMRALAKTAREQGMAAVAEIAVKSNSPTLRDSEEEHRDRIRRDVATCDAEAYALTAEVVASDEHYDPDYSKITCPVMFVVGDQDMISAPQTSEYISGLVGGQSEVVDVRSGHQMIIQDPEGVKSALSRFLSR